MTLLAGPAAVATPAAPTTRELTVAVGPEPDGSPVALDVTIRTPAAAGRHPAVLLAHGFGGDKDDLAQTAEDLTAAGYVTLTYSARGFGNSGGNIHLNSPGYEVADASRLLDALASRPDVQLDAPGDPRVAAAGVSYGGALAVELAATDPRVDATGAGITWYDLADALVPQSAVSIGATGNPATPAAIDPIAQPGVLKEQWASYFFGGSVGTPRAGLTFPPGSQSAACGRFDPTLCQQIVQAAVSSPSADLLAALHAGSPAAVIGSQTRPTPTLLMPGLQDSLFGLDQADATARALSAIGAPVRLRWLSGGHDADIATAAADRQIIGTELRSWLERHLRGDGSGGPGFSYATELDDPAGPTIDLKDYPGLGDTAQTWRTLRLSGDAQTLTSPLAGEPAATTVLPGGGGLLAAADDLGSTAYTLAALPGQSATFTTAPVQSPLTIAGASRLRLRVTSSTTDATLFVTAWVVVSSGRQTLPARVVAPVRLKTVAGQPQTVTVALAPSLLRLPAGSRLQILVSSTDAAFAVPRDPRTYQVELASDALAVPLGRAAESSRVPLLPSGVPLWLPLLVLAVCVAALVCALAARGLRRRRDVRGERADLAAVSLDVDGLVKTYPGRDGLRAVDDVSWRALPGQVVGLLGPNGAGKTTTIRMILGLIRPDAGAVHVHGHPVRPGAPVLSEVGALVEGPGSLPHLSGRANLQAYWAATGRDPDSSEIERVLEIADLGEAVHRPVRSYSQGMRQRLGIAQAMLGMPPVLVLDEPTNGLDPPQIAAMRPVLQAYAATGRTVLVSSHLLGEVEQTCSHVVVMARGRVLIAGPVADLVSGGGTAVFGLADPGRLEEACSQLAGIAGVSSVERVGDRLAVSAELDRVTLLRRVLDAGVEVVSVTDRRRLEEVFLDVIGSAGDPR